MKRFVTGKKFSALMILGFIIGNTALAESLFIERPPKITDWEDVLDSYYQLIADSIPTDQGYSIVANKDQADSVLVPKALPVGESLVLTLSKFQKGNKVASEKVKLGKVEELDFMTERLVSAVLKGVSVDQELTVGNISTSEKDKLKDRRLSRGRWLVGFGPAVGFNLKNEDAMFHYTVGYSWELEQSIIKLHVTGTDGVNDDEGYLGGVGISYGHLFSKTDTAQILSTDLIWGGAAVKKDIAAANEYEETSKKSGFTLGVGYGVMMFRTSDIALETSLVAQQFLGSIEGKSPTTVGARVTVLW